MLHLGPLGQLSVYVIPHFFQKILERTDGKNNKIFNFRTEENPVFTGFLSGVNSQLYKKFRVSPVMTTSMPLRMEALTHLSYHKFSRRATDIAAYFSPPPHEMIGRRESL